MEMHSSAIWGFIVLFLTLVVCTAGSSIGPPVHGKPGVCPCEKGPGPCVELCSDDFNCTKNKKCCSNGCGHQCFAPYTGKPGVCPCIGWGPRHCGEICSRDCDCPGNQKCCSTGCGHHCIAPYTGKPGVCPRKTVVNGICPSELCSMDCDCPDKKKCCPNRCGRQCTSPLWA
ncbi:WAP four-disulfide core domain protein 2-like [Hypomesus transpacificus]|uniref:WAP four-disulfide core domain protein 2-like n=1 Tax=Hypomesus transpacificus TaxID=137520 RepID=UPI001F085C31|nr:WAP four-disulfide core domain protein 2-like [Hypomesus transpacificus]